LGTTELARHADEVALPSKLKNQVARALGAEVAYRKRRAGSPSSV
jgi:hypothetical protein